MRKQNGLARWSTKRHTHALDFAQKRALLLTVNARRCVRATNACWWEFVTLAASQGILKRFRHVKFKCGEDDDVRRCPSCTDRRLKYSSRGVMRSVAAVPLFHSTPPILKPRLLHTPLQGYSVKLKMKHFMRYEATDAKTDDRYQLPALEPCRHFALLLLVILGLNFGSQKREGQ